MPEEIKYNYNPGNNFPRPNNELTKSQKIAVAVLAFFAIFTLILWSVQFRKNIATSFKKQTTENQQNAICPNGNCSEQTEADLRKKDTDKDGLNDYDEFNVYHTSPYLDDSDSDGFSDKKEIDSSNDPNCPVGRECDTSDQLVSSSTSDELITGNASSFSSSTMVTNPDSDVFNENMDAATLRQLLINSGAMTEEVLNGISDEELISTYKDFLKNTQ